MVKYVALKGKITPFVKGLLNCELKESKEKRGEKRKKRLERGARFEIK